MIAMGPAIFDRFLAGAREMDRHFRDAPADHNIPILMALIGIGIGMASAWIPKRSCHTNNVCIAFLHTYNKWKWSPTASG